MKISNKPADSELRITVVTPSYNQSQYLERTIQSVIHQENANFQYIVVDGLSSDGSREILEKYRDNIDHLVIEPDDGQADAIRKGFESADGDLLCYLNSDDVLLYDTLEFVADYFRIHTDVDAIYSHRIFLDKSDRITRFWTLPDHGNYFMSRWDFIPQETCFWRRSLMEKVGSIDPSFSFALDYDLFVRMMREGRFRRVNRFLGGFRIHEEAKSSRLYETTGRQEIERVRNEQNVTMHWYDQILKYMFGGSILFSSWVYKVFCIHALRKRIRFPWQQLTQTGK